MKDNLAKDLEKILKEAWADAQQKMSISYWQEDIEQEDILNGILLEKLVVYIVRRDQKIFDHAVKVGKGLK